MKPNQWMLKKVPRMVGKTLLSIFGLFLWCAPFGWPVGWFVELGRVGSAISIALGSVILNWTNYSGFVLALQKEKCSFKKNPYLRRASIPAFLTLFLILLILAKGI